MVKLCLCLAVLCTYCLLVSSQCWYNGQYFQYGQFQPEPCLSCFCFDNGVTDCFEIRCPTCLFYYYRPGECCATCEAPPNQMPTTPPPVVVKHKVGEEEGVEGTGD